MTARRRPRLRAGSRVGQLLQGSFWGLADQALMSATNFVTMVILARELAPAAFGVFVLAYTALLFVNGIQTALVTQPHNVLGQGRLGREYARYTSSTAVGQLVFTGGSTLVALSAAAVSQLVAPGAAAILLALAPAVLAWQLQEFARRVLYTENRVSTAFAADVLAYGGQVAALAVLAHLDALTGPIALYVVAATSTVSALFAGWKIRRSLIARIDRADLLTNWSFGKWLGAAIAVSWLAGQLYFYLTALTLGATATGGLKAAQIVLGPVNAFLLFLFTVLPIRFAATRERAGDGELHAELRSAYLLTGPVVLLYGLGAALFAGPLLRLLYGDTYAGYESVVMLFSAYYLVLHAVYLLTSALNAKRRTRPLFWGNLYAALVGLAFGWLLVSGWAVEGAVVGMILGAILLSVVFWRAYRGSAPAARGDARPGVAAARG